MAPNHDNMTTEKVTSETRHEIKEAYNNNKPTEKHFISFNSL